MIGQETLLVTLVRLVNRIPLVAPVKQRKRGRPATYPDRLFLQALVIMIVRHLYTVHELLSVLVGTDSGDADIAQPLDHRWPFSDTADMGTTFAGTAGNVAGADRLPWSRAGEHAAAVGKLRTSGGH